MPADPSVSQHTEAERRGSKCCACCDEGTEPGRCVFNGRRDDHAGPCEYCDPIGYKAWIEAPRPEVSDAPF